MFRIRADCDSAGQTLIAHLLFFAAEREIGKKGNRKHGN